MYILYIYCKYHVNEIKPVDIIYLIIWKILICFYNLGYRYFNSYFLTFIISSQCKFNSISTFSFQKYLTFLYRLYVNPCFHFIQIFNTNQFSGFIVNIFMTQFCEYTTRILRVVYLIRNFKFLIDNTIVIDKYHRK